MPAMPDYQQCLAEVEQATDRLDSIDALDQAAVQQALDARAASIERLSAALVGTPRAEIAGGVERRIRAVLGKGNCAMIRLSSARQSLAVQLAHTQSAHQTAGAMRAALDPQVHLCRWEG